LGLWGWGNPLLCAGYLLPCTREAGLLAVLLAWMGLWHCAEKRPRLFRAALVPIVLYAAFMSPVSRLESRTPEDWEGLDTSFGVLLSGSDDSIGPYLRRQILSIMMKHSEAKYVVFPETVAGWWGMTTESLWRDDTNSFASQDRTFFVGAETTLRGTKHYYNVVQVRGKNHATVRQRYPVPFSMWRPWNEKSAVADWFGSSGTVKVDDLTVGILVCYEPYLFWPCLQTMICRPDVLVAVSNSWWSRNTNIPRISDKCVKSWALLYDVPFVLSKNL
jgi:apolipoprotein N-acyltransferase